MQDFEVEWELVQQQKQSNNYITEEFMSSKEWK